MAETIEEALGRIRGRIAELPEHAECFSVRPLVEACEILAEELDSIMCSCTTTGQYVEANKTHERWCAHIQARAALSAAAQRLGGTK